MEKIACFKAYDIRGKQPEDLNPTLAYHLGAALAKALPSAKTAVLGMDSRATSPMLLRAFAAGLASQGVTCQSLGLCGTEETYHAAGSGHCDVAIMVTASHNPIEYNGFKVCKRGGVPLDLTTEFSAWHTHTLALQGVSVPEQFPEVPSLNLRAEYCAHLLSLIDAASIPAQTIVINAGNGAAGPTADALLAHLPQLNVVRVHHTPDGTFPNGIPNPLLPGNRASTADAVRAHKASLGVAWDGDFDRCFFYDETGEFISGYYTATLLAEATLQKETGATIVHDPRLYWATVAAIKKVGGVPLIAKVGHGYIKPAMRAHNAPFAGEISSHFYFRDFYSCDSGMLPMLMLLSLLGQRGQTLGQAVANLKANFPASDELNFTTPLPAKAFLAELEAHLLALAPQHARIDGLELTDEQAGWRASIRASSNEPLLRLNVEARSPENLDIKLKLMVNLIEDYGAKPAEEH